MSDICPVGKMDDLLFKVQGWNSEYVMDSHPSFVSDFVTLEKSFHFSIPQFSFVKCGYHCPSGMLHDLTK